MENRPHCRPKTTFIKAITVLTVMMLIGLLAGCGLKKKESQTTFKISAGSVFSGVPMHGGGILRGNSGANSFSLTLSDLMSANHTFQLPFGVWTFRVIGWAGELNAVNGSYDKMTGAQYCELFTVDINQSTQDVKLILNPQKCGNADFSDPNYLMNEVVGGKNAQQFKPVRVQLCENLNGIIDGNSTCAIGVNNNSPSQYLSFRVAYLPGGNLPIPRSNPDVRSNWLISNCYNVVNPISNGVKSPIYLTNLRLPLGGTKPFPSAVLFYNDNKCGKEDTDPRFPQGFGQVGIGAGGDSKIFPTGGSNPTFARLNIPGNYFALGNPLLMAQRPHFSCGADGNGNNVACNFNIATNTVSPEANFQRVRERLGELIGTQDGLDFYEMPKKAEYRDSGNRILIQAALPGPGGNGYSFAFSDSPGCNGGPTITMSSNVFSVCADGASHTFTSLIDALNGHFATNGIALTASTSIGGTPYTAAVLDGTTSGGKLDTIEGRNFNGKIGEAANWLSGAIGLLARQSGVTSCEELAVGSNYFYSDHKGSVLMEVVPPTKSIPAPMHGAGTQFDRAIEWSDNGIQTSRFEFNCPTTGKPLRSGYYKKIESSTELFPGYISTYKIEMFYSHDTDGNAQIQLVTGMSAPGLMESKEIFVLEKSTPQTFKFFRSEIFETFISGAFDIESTNRMTGEVDVIQGIETNFINYHPDPILSDAESFLEPVVGPEFGIMNQCFDGAGNAGANLFCNGVTLAPPNVSYPIFTSGHFSSNALESYLNGLSF